MKLPPLDQVDKDLHLGFSETVDVTPARCKHELYLKDSHTAACKHCTAQWSGFNIQKLVEASKTG